jgi:hypothetical protein
MIEHARRPGPRLAERGVTAGQNPSEVRSNAAALEEVYTVVAERRVSTSWWTQPKGTL